MRFIFLLILFFSCEISAMIYKEQEIVDRVNQAGVQHSTTEFIRKYFTSNNPQKFILHYKNSMTNKLVMEYQLYTLLDNISRMTIQPYLKEFVFQMKDYKPQSFKYHEEGNMQIPIYNITARAKGIENIWLATDSFNFYSHSFENNPIETLKNLMGDVNFMEAPKWLGLKNSISKMSAASHLQIVDYILKSPRNSIGLDKFVSHYALLTANQKLIKTTLQYLDRSNSEFVLRHMSTYFSEEFVAQQLKSAVIMKISQVFAITMMAPYVDSNKEVTAFLINNLPNKHLSSSIAFVLSKSSNRNTLKKLSGIYQSSQSDYLKKQIRFSLKINKSNEAQHFYNNLIEEVK